METVNTNDINIKEIVDRMTKIKAEEKTLSEEYTLLQAQLQMIGESDLENTKRKSVSYLGNGSKATVTIADKVASILPALFKDIFGKAYSDLVTEKHTVELNAEGKRLVASIWNGDYCSGSVEEIVSKLDCDEKAKKSLLKKLNGKNYETDKKNLIKLGVLKWASRRTAYAKGYARVCRSSDIQQAISNKRLAAFGLISMLDYYTERRVTC